MRTIKVILFMTLTLLMVGCTAQHRPSVLVVKEVEIVNENLYRYTIKSVTPAGTTWESFSYFTYDFIGMPGDTVKFVK